MISSRLGTSSSAKNVMPVRLCPGRAKLSTTLPITGSPLKVNRTGTSTRASIMARADSPPCATTTSGLRSTILGAASFRVAAEPSPHHVSIVRLRPSTQPSSRMPRRKASRLEEFDDARSLETQATRAWVRGCAKARVASQGETATIRLAARRSIAVLWQVKSASLRGCPQVFQRKRDAGRAHGAAFARRYARAAPLSAARRASFVQAVSISPCSVATSSSGRPR